MFTALLHHFTITYVFFYFILYWIQQEGKRQEESDADVEARQRMVSNTKIEQVLVATRCDWLKNLVTPNWPISKTKSYASGSHAFPALGTSYVYLLRVLIGSSSCLCWFWLYIIISFFNGAELKVASLQQLSLFCPLLLLNILVHLRWLSTFSL